MIDTHGVGTHVFCHRSESTCSAETNRARGVSQRIPQQFHNFLRECARLLNSGTRFAQL
jgi:hypothetical protein